MPLLSRRGFIGATGIAAVAGAITLRPSDKGAPYEPYFAQLNQALKAAGIGTPTMVIDRERLHANAQHVTAHVQGRLRLRLVNKSLPCMPLLDELAKLTDTQRQMVFNLPYLQQLTQQRPHSQVLLGKPMPVAAAARFYAAPPTSGFDVNHQLEWLIDTPERLQQYRDLARAQKRAMRINIEIDVGLHRGGVPDLDVMKTIVQLMAQEPLLQWSGLMGYDAHTEKIPDVAGLRDKARAHSKQTYQRFADFMQASPLKADRNALTLNTGGSPSFKLHDGSGAANEVAVGSAMVKASDFDTPLLTDLQAAAFIATPLLKTGRFVAPDGVEELSAAAGWWDPNQRQSHFIYGGHWLANPVSPAGLSPSGLIGPSSNQQILLGSGKQALRPDDFVFLRPTQSEAVLQQFGDIAVYEKGRITEMWPVFPAQA
jgi:D-serine deaminase-like pyridoxal phosphate-dependent protein